MNSTLMYVLSIFILATFDLVYPKQKSVYPTRALSDSILWEQNLMVINNGTINQLEIKFHSAPIRHDVHSTSNYTYYLTNEVLDVSLEVHGAIKLFNLTLRNASISTQGGFHRPGQIEIPLGNQDQYFNAFQQKNAKWPLKFVNSSPEPLNDLLYDQYPVRISEPLFYKSSGLAFLFDERNPLFVQQYNSPSHGYGIGYFYSNNTNPYMVQDVESSYRNLRFHVIVSNENDVSKVVDYLAKNSTFMPKATSIPSEELFIYPTWLYTQVKDDDYVNEPQFCRRLHDHGFTNGTIIRPFNFLDMDAIRLATRYADACRYYGFETQVIFSPILPHNSADLLGQFTIPKTDGKSTLNYDFSDPNVVNFLSAEVFQNLTNNASVSVYLENYGSFENYKAHDSDCNKYPSMLLTKFVQEVSKTEFPFSISSEVAFKNQDIPMVVQLRHNDTRENLLESLVVNALAVSIAGYSNISPNPFNFTGSSEIESELFTRWIQAITFMPHVTFYVHPWKHEENWSKIAHQFLKLHLEHAPTLIQLAKMRLTTGKPIIRPMWYQYPKQSQFFNVADQFMVGDDILVAPVIKLGQRERTVILPPGSWIDQHGKPLNYSDSIQIIRVKAPLEELPYFKRKH